ncbi:hypothetical protein [Thermocatellispora tengchongensis]|uniref:hypothetical protein n=1 Tax=Thermocatellispora tengchongensis TaxID=1073253 RepID=UPI00363D9FF8
MATTLGMTAACGGGGEETAGGGSSSAPAEKITLTLQTFGGGTNFGYKAAVEKWNAEHPNIQVKYNNLTPDFENTYWPQMLNWLQAGKGAGDVIGIDEGGMGLAKARPQFFTDLSQYGLLNRQNDFPAWKWENGINAEGKLFALGTDVGGMSVATARTCSRRPVCRPTARRSPSSGRPGTTSSPPGRSSRRRSRTSSSWTA